MDFSSFLENFIKSNRLTNAGLAEKINVPAATISHLLSGRNKPSLEFIQKLIRVYPTLDLYAILNLEKYNLNKINKLNEKEGKDDSKIDLFSSTKKVKKIVLLYEDNTFEEYNYKKE